MTCSDDSASAVIVAIVTFIRVIHRRVHTAAVPEWWWAR